jgi:hypothetical protein
MSDPPQTFGSFSAEMIRDDFFGQNKYRPELSFVVRSKTMPFDDLTPGDLVIWSRLIQIVVACLAFAPLVMFNVNFSV